MIVTQNDDNDEILAFLIPDIHKTALIVQQCCSKLEPVKHKNAVCYVGSIDRPLSKSIEQRYLEVMKTLQFGKFAMTLCLSFISLDNNFSFITFFLL